MKENRHPGNSGECPFYIDAEDPLTAEASIFQCVTCATRGHTKLKDRQDDFRQIAYLTILEETPKYDPAHPNQASFITFMKSRVCSQLWSERRKELKYLPFSVASESPCDTSRVSNPLSAELYNEACARESLEDEVLTKIEIQQFRERLSGLLHRLTEKERQVVRLKYFHDYTGMEIAESLGVSKGRVSQMMKSALTKLKTAYLRLKDGCPV